jgi:hypothetical protein
MTYVVQTNKVLRIHAEQSTEAQDDLSMRENINLWGKRTEA